MAHPRLSLLPSRVIAAAALGGLLALVACSGSMSDGDPLADDGGTTGPGEDGGAAPGEDAGTTTPEEDAGTTTPGDDAGTPGEDAGPPPEGRVAAFIAQGHVGRTTLSCDDGRSWVADQSMDDSLRCFVDDTDCDHHPGAGKGISYGRDYWFATYGWGPPGGIRRSTNGVDWTEVLGETTFGGIAVGPESVVAGARNARRTTDDGESWVDTGDTTLSVWNVRRVGYLAEAGLFVLVADESDIVFSSDEGASWWHADAMPDTCGRSIQTAGGIAEGDGTLLILGGDGVACTSTDGGARWSAAEVGQDGLGQLVWDGEAFVTFSNGRVHRSADGVSWTSEDTTPSVRVGPAAYSPETGTIVGVRGGWRTWYGDQVFWRSTDGGRTWEEAGSFTGSHPIRFVEFGWVEPSPACPGS